MRRILLSFFGAGYLRPAPGTWGSLAALPAAWLLHHLGGPFVLVLAAGALYFAGVKATEIETAGTEDHDPGWIVADEVVGQWIALLPISLFAWFSDEMLIRHWLSCFVALLFFRLFDIWKPWIIGRIDARGDAIGVMLDDVVAGVFAALAVLLLYGIAISWFLISFSAPS